MLNIHKIPRVFKENIRLSISLLAIAALLVGILGVHDFQDNSKTTSACGFRDDKTVTIGSYKIKVEVAKTNAARQKGLSGRPCIGQNEGMLFVFDQPGEYSFWMKGMKFPIDMVWISTGHKTVVVEENVSPSTYNSKYPYFVNPQSEPAQYVLELQANSATRLGIDAGTPINF